MTVSGISWTGIDGSVWDLLGGGQGVSLGYGLSGLHLPSFTQQVSKASRLPGQTYLGTVYNARDVILSITVQPTATSTWTQVDDAWWASLSPEQTGTLTVTTEYGSRSLTCRLGAAGDPSLDRDPSVVGIGQYALTLEADQPFWSGPAVAQTFQLPTTAQPYYGGTGGGGVGPPFFISPASSLANATVSNTGDRPAYSVWQFTGPGVVTFTISGHSTTLPTLAAGQTVQVDTNPLTPSSVTDVSHGGSVNFWPQMGAHDFWQPIPAYSTGYPVPISVSGGVAGQSSITVSLTPLFNRAW